MFFSLLLALAGGTLAYASPPEEIGGTFELNQSTQIVTSVRSAGPNTLISFTRTDSPISGGADGLFDTLGAKVVVFADGSSTGRSTLLIEGTVAGMEGIWLQNTVFASDGVTTTGTYAWYGGTGDLTGLHGTGTFKIENNLGEYSGTFHLDP